jgi:hypothetical protein
METQYLLSKMLKQANNSLPEACNDAIHDIFMANSFYPTMKTLPGRLDHRYSPWFGS